MIDIQIFHSVILKGSNFFARRNYTIEKRKQLQCLVVFVMEKTIIHDVPKNDRVLI